MNPLYNSFVETLKSAGFSSTAVRRKVFTELSGKEPQTMQELLAVSIDIDRASVYRSVELFEKLGIVQRIHLGWKYKIELTDAYQEHHHHLSCIRCGLLISIEGDTHIESDIKDITVAHGFSEATHQIEIRGICSKCS